MKTQWVFCQWWLVAVELVCAQQLYDVYFGKPVTDKRRDFMTSRNSSSICTILVKPCDVSEGRRVDGTCTNPRYPTRGAALTPLPRLLPAKFGPGNTLRPAKDGSDLPSARVIRTTLLAEGYIVDHPFTQLASHFFVLAVIDSASFDDALSYALVSDCCLGNRPNRENPKCIAISVPEKDPYIRQTGIRCMNLTRQTTFEDIGCVPSNIPGARVSRATPLLDLSPVYGNSDVSGQSIRLMKDGLLKSEMHGNREVPPGKSLVCLNNKAPLENYCYEYGDQFNSNLLMGTILGALWYFREHNRIARKLKDINPCWDDDKLFQVARTINIASRQHIFFYELMSEMLGKKNAISEGIIYDTYGYVEDFDEHSEPGIVSEYSLGTRWFHTFQDGRTDLYDKKGKFVGTRPTVNDEFRSGTLEINDTEAQLNRGSFYQASSKFDYNIDPDLVERVFGDFQSASDLSAIDIMRGRDAGLPPYNEYRKLCGLPVAKKFDDFSDTIDKGRVEAISRLYEDVEDVEFMAAVYTEKLIPGGWVGPTLYCVMVNNLLLWRRSDLYFYEHGNHPARFTLPQLNEIRKSTVSRVMCDSGDGVKEIQPKGFIQIGHGNELVPCERIPRVDLYKWRDPVCQKDSDYDSKMSFSNGKDKTSKIGWESYFNVFNYYK